MRSLIAAFAASLALVGAAQAACSTGEPKCAGPATFGPFADPITCFMIYHVAGGYTGFCLRPDETRQVVVRSGDAYCGVTDAEPPPADCERDWILVD